MNARATLLELAVDAQSGREVRERMVRAGGLIQAAELLRFLEITVADYDEASRRLTDHAQRRESMAQGRAPGPRLLEPDEIESAAVGEELDAVLHLRIETFYVFAKLLLDKLAQAIEHFIGRDPDISLGKHSKLRTNLTNYSCVKNLSSPVEILRLAASLERIVAFREKQVVHAESPRAFKGTTFDADGKGLVAPGRVFPSHDEKESKQLNTASEGLHELLAEIDAYVEAICAYLRRN